MSHLKWHYPWHFPSQALNRTLWENSDVYKQHTCHEKQIFSIPYRFDVKTCPWNFRKEGRSCYSAEPLIWLLVNMYHEHSTNNKFLALHFYLIAITRSFQSLRTMKLFDNSVFGILESNNPKILKNYFLTSMIREGLYYLSYNVLVVNVISTKYKCVFGWYKHSFCWLIITELIRIWKNRILEK